MALRKIKEKQIWLIFLWPFLSIFPLFTWKSFQRSEYKKLSQNSFLFMAAEFLLFCSRFLFSLSGFGGREEDCSNYWNLRNYLSSRRLTNPHPFLEISLEEWFSSFGSSEKNDWSLMIMKANLLFEIFFLFKEKIFSNLMISLRFWQFFIFWLKVWWSEMLLFL